MTGDFVTQLRGQLRDAADREGRRGPVARAALDARVAVASEPAVGALALVLLAVVVATFAGLLRGPRETAQLHRGPHLVARVQLVDNGGTMVPGFGAVWAVDNVNGQVLRVDPRTRRVVARVSVGDQAMVDVGAGAVWALAANQPYLYEIDPHVNRVVARVALGSKAGGLLVSGRDVWAATAGALVHVDVARNSVDRRVSTAHRGFVLVSGTTGAGSLFLQRGDGVVVRLDGHTGARLGSWRAPLDGTLVGVTPEGLIMVSDREVAAVDADSGRQLWRRTLGTGMDGGIVDGDSVWIHGTDLARPQDRLWRLETGHGRLTGSVALPDFGAAGGAVVGDQVWVMSGGGSLEVIAR